MFKLRENTPTVQVVVHFHAPFCKKLGRFSKKMGYLGLPEFLRAVAINTFVSYGMHPKQRVEIELQEELEEGEESHSRLEKEFEHKSKTKQPSLDQTYR